MPVNEGVLVASSIKEREYQGSRLDVYLLGTGERGCIEALNGS